MYAVEVREHIMIAHSFKGELFGPAQALHGATFIVDVAFFRPDITKDEAPDNDRISNPSHFRQDGGCRKGGCARAGI
jgi:hypothetical protein